MINIQRVPQVIDLYENPAHEEWGRGTAWTLFNAATQALDGRVVESPHGTRKLHDVIEAICDIA